MEKQKEQQEKTIELCIGMCTDYLLGKGPTDDALVSNLRLIADKLEELFKK